MDSMMLFTVMSSVAMYFLAAALLVPFVLYVIARWRAHREQHVDPQIGIKVALGYFEVMGLQVALGGLVMFVYAVISEEGADRGWLYRTALGLLLAGSLVCIAHVVLLRKTNQAQYPSVARLFLGYNLVITGVLGFVALVMACEALFARASERHGFGRQAAAALVVYGAAWAVSGWRFAKLVLPPFGDAGGPPHHVVGPTPSPPDMPPAGPVLPPLGGGSFPPISPAGGT